VALRLRLLRREELGPEQRALYDAIVASRGAGVVAPDGTLIGPFNAMLYHPGVGAPLQAVGGAVRYAGVLPPAARELAILTVAAAHGAEFEWLHHAPLAAELGVPPEAVEAIRLGRRPELADPLEEAVVDVTRALLAHEDLDDKAYEHAASVIGEAELVELTTLVGYYATLAMQMRFFGVPVPPAEEG
jgi:4-carboxymuconolactone decarboxylase